MCQDPGAPFILYVVDSIATISENGIPANATGVHTNKRRNNPSTSYTVCQSAKFPGASHGFSTSWDCSRLGLWVFPPTILSPRTPPLCPTSPESCTTPQPSPTQTFAARVFVRLCRYNPFHPAHASMATIPQTYSETPHSQHLHSNISLHLHLSPTRGHPYSFPRPACLG